MQEAKSRRLVIDCATEACSVALFDGDVLIDGAFHMLGRGHAERLIPLIAALPDKGQAGTIAVNCGPGSFTGIRVGLAAAKALAFAWDAQLVGYDGLALVAAIARDEQGPGPVDVAMTGGHGEWFVAHFDPQGAQTLPSTSHVPADAVAASTAPVVCGSQAEALVAARGSGRAIALWPDARRANLLRPNDLSADPHPAYGRAPDARPSAARFPQSAG